MALFIAIGMCLLILTTALDFGSQNQGSDFLIMLTIIILSIIAQVHPDDRDLQPGDPDPTFFLKSLTGEIFFSLPQKVISASSGATTMKS